MAAGHKGNPSSIRAVPLLWDGLFLTVRWIVSWTARDCLMQRLPPWTRRVGSPGRPCVQPGSLCVSSPGGQHTCGPSPACSQPEKQACIQLRTQRAATPEPDVYAAIGSSTPAAWGSARNQPIPACVQSGVDIRTTHVPGILTTPKPWLPGIPASREAGIHTALSPGMQPIPRPRLAGGPRACKHETKNRYAWSKIASRVRERP